MRRATFNHTREDSPLMPCPECAVDMYWELLLRVGRTFSANLTIAAALCAAFDMGRDAGPGKFVPFVNCWWRPGCGKPWAWPHMIREDAP